MDFLAPLHGGYYEDDRGINNVSNRVRQNGEAADVLDALDPVQVTLATRRVRELRL